MTTIVQNVAFALLIDLEKHYKQEHNFSFELLQALHSVFGKVLIEATELLENGKFVQYESKSKLRKIFKVGSRHEYYTLFPNLNFCRCKDFENEVLNNKSLTCKHVLAARLADISAKFQLEEISDNLLADLLNDQIDEL